MNQFDEMEVDAFLLIFSELTEEQQKAFLETVNRYLFVSPSQRREMRLRWEQSCDG